MHDPENRKRDADGSATHQTAGARAPSNIAPRAGAAVIRQREQDFTRFAIDHRPMATIYVERLLRGVSDSEVDRDGIVQEAFTRAWTSWTSWPMSLGRRRAYLKRTLRLCGLDALRRVRGRGAATTISIPMSFTAYNGGQDADRGAVDTCALLAISVADNTTTVLDRIVTATALRALTDLERRAIALSAQGLNDQEVAKVLGVTHQRARTVLMEGRALLRSLVAHANAEPADEEIWPLAGAATGRRTARLVRRHLEACPTCRDAGAPARRSGTPTPLRSPTRAASSTTTAMHRTRFARG